MIIKSIKKKATRKDAPKGQKHILRKGNRSQQGEEEGDEEEDEEQRPVVKGERGRGKGEGEGDEGERKRELGKGRKGTTRTPSMTKGKGG